MKTILKCKTSSGLNEKVEFTDKKINDFNQKRQNFTFKDNSKGETFISPKKPKIKFNQKTQFTRNIYSFYPNKDDENALYKINDNNHVKFKINLINNYSKTNTNDTNDINDNTENNKNNEKKKNYFNRISSYNTLGKLYYSCENIKNNNHYENNNRAINNNDNLRKIKLIKKVSNNNNNNYIVIKGDNNHNINSNNDNYNNKLSNFSSSDHFLYSTTYDNTDNQNKKQYNILPELSKKNNKLEKNNLINKSHKSKSGKRNSVLRERVLELIKEIDHSNGRSRQKKNNNTKSNLIENSKHKKIKSLQTEIQSQFKSPTSLSTIPNLLTPSADKKGNSRKGRGKGKRGSVIEYIPNNKILTCSINVNNNTNKLIKKPKNNYELNKLIIDSFGIVKDGDPQYAKKIYNLSETFFNISSNMKQKRSEIEIAKFEKTKLKYDNETGKFNINSISLLGNNDNNYMRWEKKYFLKQYEETLCEEKFKQFKKENKILSKKKIFEKSKKLAHLILTNDCEEYEEPNPETKYFRSSGKCFSKTNINRIKRIKGILKNIEDNERTDTFNVDVEKLKEDKKKNEEDLLLAIKRAGIPRFIITNFKSKTMKKYKKVSGGFFGIPV